MKNIFFIIAFSFLPKIYCTETIFTKKIHNVEFNLLFDVKFDGSFLDDLSAINELPLDKSVLCIYRLVAKINGNSHEIMKIYDFAPVALYGSLDHDSRFMVFDIVKVNTSYYILYKRSGFVFISEYKKMDVDMIWVNITTTLVGKKNNNSFGDLSINIINDGYIEVSNENQIRPIYFNMANQQRFIKEKGDYKIVNNAYFLE